MYYCIDCGVELEDHGHTNAGDYHEKSLCCPKCGADYDYDSRRKQEWKPREPYFGSFAPPTQEELERRKYIRAHKYTCETCNFVNDRGDRICPCPIVVREPRLDLRDSIVLFYYISLIGCRSWKEKN